MYKPGNKKRKERSEKEERESAITKKLPKITTFFNTSPSSSNTDRRRPQTSDVVEQPVTEDAVEHEHRIRHIDRYPVEERVEQQAIDVQSSHLLM